MHSWATEIFFYKFLTKKNKQIGLFYLNSWYYNAAGVKVSKNGILGLSTANNLQTSNTLYLGGYQYNNEILQFFPHAQGYVNHLVSEKDESSLFDYVYQYKDHLGNIRINYTFDTSTGSLKVLEENHYYPFGLKHTNNQYTRDIKEEKETVDGEDKWEKKVVQVPNSGYQYKYNGKEWQDELGQNVYAYGWRDYDPAIGRFQKLDRFSEKYYKMTPYGYAGNNPVLINDIQGDSLWISFGKNEKVLYENGNLLSKGSDGKFSAYKGDQAKIDKKTGEVKGYKGFLGETVKALDGLRNGSSFANGIIGTLQGSDNNFNVKEGNASFRSDLKHPSGRMGVLNNNGYAFQVLEQGKNLVDYAPFDQIGSGGDIYWNPNAGDDMITLGHELGHGFDSDMGMLDSRRIMFNGGLEEIREIRGVYYENRIRQDLGKTLRGSYTSDGPKLLNSLGNPMFIQPPSILFLGL